MAKARVRIAGRAWLHQLGWYGDLQWSHVWPGGCEETSWGMAGLARRIAHPLLKRGALVEIYCGTRVWVGTLNEPSDAMDAFVATGLYREAERFGAIDAAGIPTTDPDLATTQAVADGAPFTYRPGTAPAPVPGEEWRFLNELNDVAATAAGKRWGVEADAALVFRADPTTPSLHIVPGSGAMGAADDSYATHLYGEYMATTTTRSIVTSAAPAATVERYGRAAYFVDLKPLGVVSAGVARTVLDGMLTNGRARMGYSNGLSDLLAGRVLKAGGVPANLAHLRAGQMARLHGVYDTDRNLIPGATHDFVIGRTVYQAGARTIQIDPIGLTDRTLSDVLSLQEIQPESVAS